MVKIPEFYPNVHLILEPSKNLMGKFVDGPQGITVHYTASRDLASTHRTLMDKGYNYHLIIDRQGKVTQTANLAYRVNHAGKAMWNNKSPNRTHIAIALLSWGMLKDGKNWIGKRLPDEEIAQRGGAQWDKALMVQEEALLTLCRWFICMGIPPGDICGHDECALPLGRKLDPGGVLSWSMAEFRRLVVSVMS